MLLDERLATLEGLLGRVERHARTMLGTVRALRRQAAHGDLAAIDRSFRDAPRQVEQVGAALNEARETFSYDADSEFASGAYTAELLAAARENGLILVERDGRLTAFPLLLKLDAKSPGVRVGRRLERQIRPSVLVERLKKLQTAEAFHPGAFLGLLFEAYADLAPGEQPGWRENKPGQGPVVRLVDIHDALTRLPVAAEAYPRAAFACDLLRLNRHPDTRTRRGHQFALPASTGSKGAGRLTVYDEHGAEHTYVGIRFSLDAPAPETEPPVEASQ
jgi:hypothetical protein